MATEQGKETVVVKDDDFDAAFAEAIGASEGDAEKKDDKAGAAAAAASSDDDAGDTLDGKTPEQIEAEKKAADEAAAQKAADEKAAAEKKAADDAAQKTDDEKAAAEKKAAEEAAAAGADPAAKAAAEKKAAEESARKLAEEAAAKVAADAAAKAAADKKAAEEAAAAKEIKDPVLSDEHKKKIEEFEKEWPDIAVAVKAQQEHAIAAIEARFARALTAVVNKVYADIAPMAESFVGIESKSFRDTVLEKHPDYDAVYPKLEAWIGTQPSYLAEAYKRVYTDGNAQEITDLVSRYKEANGVKPQVPDTGTSKNPPAPDPKADAARKAAADLAPVSGKRTTPTPSGTDPNDFDGAFAEAAAALTK